MANVWYPDNNNYWSGYSSNTSNVTTFKYVTSWPPAPVPEPKKGEEDPLEWLARQVDEICELSGIAA